MLSSMRNNRKLLSVVLWLVIIAFVSTIFVVWGIGSRENQASYAVKIGDTTVGYEEYRNFYDETVQMLRGIYGELYDEYAKTQNMDARIMNELINKKLLLKEAERLGIPASDYEVIETIKVVPGFQNEKGSFDPQRYVEVLNYYRQTTTVFEKSVRDSILIDKLQNLIKNGEYVVSDTAIMGEYNYRGTEAQVEYFSVPVTKFIATAEPVEAALNAYYEANKNSYKIPAEIKLKYVVFEENKFSADNITVDPKEVESYYAENISSYKVPESVVIRNIVVPVVDWNNKSLVDKAKEKIDAAYAALKKDGSNFAAIVKKHSDPAMSANDGLIGTITRGQLQPTFEEAVFAVEPGKFTEVLTTDYGYHIVKVDEKSAEKTFTLDEKRAEINALLKNQKVAGAFRTYVLGIYKDILKAGNITAYMAGKPDSSLNVISTPLFSENEIGLPVFLSKPEVKRDLFVLGKTELSPIVEDGKATYLFEIEDKVLSKIPALADVKKQVVEAYKLEEAAKAAVIDVEKSIAGEGFEKSAKKFGVAVQKTGEFKRSVPDAVIASATALIDGVFKSKPGETLKNAYIVGGNVFAVKVLSILPPSSDGYEGEKDMIAAYIRSVKEEEALTSYIASLRAKTKIEINPSFLNNDAK